MTKAQFDTASVRKRLRQVTIQRGLVEGIDCRKAVGPPLRATGPKKQFTFTIEIVNRDSTD